MPQTSISQAVGVSATNPLITALKSDNGMILAACLLGLAALSLLDNTRKKGKIAKSHFSSTTEKTAARRQAHQQLKAPQRNSLSLYVGKPQSFQNQTLYIPDAQRGAAVCGGPGSGKTFSIIDPAVRSAIDQGFPIILYDFKYPTQTSRLAGYARSQGYKVRVFAPGFPESEVCNPLDFLRDKTDSLMARQIAEVMNKNFSVMSGGSGSKEDPFFTSAGDQLTEAVFMLAKSTRYPDIMMCQALLSLKNLAKRLEVNADHLDPWIHSSFGQLISVGESEKTVASIVATANTNFTKFMKADLLAAFCGETTIPLDLEGRQMLILGLDRERRDIVGPLVATVLHMIVNRNVSKKRQDPLILALDELPTLYLPALVQWLNENREDGLVSILGFQNLAQLEKTYGKELSRAIIGGCATKAIFNPQEYESARLFSDFLGDEEVHYQQKSRGRSGGKASTNRSEQDKTRKLFEPSQFLKLPTGHCIFINPAYRTAREAAVPSYQNIRISKPELAAVKDSEKTWKTLQTELVRRNALEKPSATQLKDRYLLADQMLPLETGGKEEGKERNNKLQPDMAELVSELHRRRKG